MSWVALFPTTGFCCLSTAHSCGTKVDVKHIWLAKLEVVHTQKNIVFFSNWIGRAKEVIFLSLLRISFDSCDVHILHLSLTLVEKTLKCCCVCRLRKYLLCSNLVHKIIILSLRWNLVPRLIRICTIQWYGYFFLFDQKYPFWVNMVQNIRIVGLS